MRTALSIVTGTRNRPDSFNRFAESIVKYASVPTEVVVCDASDGMDYVAPWLTHEGQVEFKLICEEQRLGPIRGYNVGFRECTADMVVWFNDDVEVLPGWDSVGLEFMEANPQVGCGIIYFKDHLGSQWGTRFQTQSLNHIVYPNFAFVPKHVGDEVGWFDEELGFMYGGDTAFGYNVIWNGYEVVPIPGCKILHWRERDEERSNTRPLTRGDRSLFDSKWVPRLSELREKCKPFEHKWNPRYID